MQLWLLLTALPFIACKPVHSALRPVVIWHGLGDSHSSPGMLDFQSLISRVHPGIFIHSIYIDKELDKDRQAGFYGDINAQLQNVSEQVLSIPELGNGFDAIGFSQGGQFLRAYVQRYNKPPVHNLLTFGSQHMGISDIPECKPYDVFCQIARRAVKRAVYSPWSQTNLIQAQYFRDPTQLDTYLERSQFLADINNERPDSRNETYSSNLASLNLLALIMFSEDKTVVPKESSWFGSESVSEGTLKPWRLWFSQTTLSGPRPYPNGNEREIIPMRAQPLYQEDWIGLRQLDESGRVVFETCLGPHMDISECWERLITTYTGGAI